VFVQLSYLKDYSNALPNRGQDGLAKRGPYGDEDRQRISGQCIKAGYRGGQPMIAIIDGKEVSDDMRAFADRIGIGMSMRSRHVFDALVAPKLAKEFGSEDNAKAWSRAFADLFLKPADAGIARTDEDSKAYSSGYVDQPIVIGEKEAEAIIAAAMIFRDNGVDPFGGTGDLRALFEKRGMAKKFAKRLVDAETIKPEEAEASEKLLEDAVTNIRALKAHAGMDGALFGRMATGSVVSRVESCVHVAHAITVHAIQATADYFSVQDTLKDEDDPGASHTNNSEIASGLFYEYVVIDLRQITQNFASLTPEQQAEIVGWMVRIVYAAEPSAKRGSTAGYGAGLYYLAEVGKRQPRTLAAAFQKALPLKGNAPMWRRAVAALTEHREDLNIKAGAPKAAYDTEQADIRDDARSTNRAAYEVIADRVMADVLPWLQSQRESYQAAAE
jgi:CRISPR system Cascade subunit CasC